MNLLEFIRLIARSWKWLFVFPLCTALIVFFLTRNAKKEYTSSTLVYTGIASGYSITSGEDERVDYFAVNNAFDNLMATIKARETIEEVAMRLLAHHFLINKPAFNKISTENFEHLKELINPALRKKLVVPGSDEATFERILAYRNSSENNDITELINSSGEIYSMEVINANMSATRKQSSDMIEVTYKAGDPAVCQQTLQYIVDVFVKRYKGMKGTETNNVVKYFEEQLRLAAERLRKSEEKLKDFSSQHKIINYYEQAKFVAESKEDVTMDQQKQRMSLEASKAALKRIEEKMDMKRSLLEVNDKITSIREQLSQVNYKIANAELYNEDKENLSKYRAQAESLKKQIKSEVEDQYKWNNTTEGLPRTNLLNDWLTNYLGVEENESKLEVIDKRLNNFDNIFNDLAPVGSKLKQIEREVDINEKEYLSILHGLNLAKLRQQNLEMSNSLSVTDLPFFPLKPLPGKRMLLVLMSFVATFIITLAVLLGKTMLGKTIKSPARAEKFTGLKFIGALPDYNRMDKKIRADVLEEILLSQLSSNLQMEVDQGEQGKDKQLIPIYSNKAGEGKSKFIEKLGAKLQDKVGDILWLQPDDQYLRNVNIPGVTTIKYTDNGKFHRAENFDAWAKDHQVDKTKFKFILLELSELTKYDLASNIVKNAALSLMVLDSDRVWADADARALRHFTKATETKSMILLNKVDIDRLETIVGEIPKVRTKFRRIAKKVVTFDYNKT